MSAPIFQRGKAAIHGVAGTFDVIVYPIQQKVKMTQTFDEEIVKDVDGGDVAWIARNERGEFNVGVKFLADTAAHAATPVSTTISSLGQPFLAPYATVTLSTFVLSALNGAYQNISGTEYDAENVKIADGDYKLRRYADPTQNTLATTAPS